MKLDYRIRVKQFFEDLYPFIKDAITIDDYVSGLREYNHAYNQHVRLRYGTTRVVFLRADYVIKLDYGGFGIDAGTCMDELYRYVQACDDGYEDVLVPITQGCIIINTIILCRARKV